MRKFFLFFINIFFLFSILNTLSVDQVTIINNMHDYNTFAQFNGSAQCDGTLPSGSEYLCYNDNNDCMWYDGINDEISSYCFTYNSYNITINMTNSFFANYLQFTTYHQDHNSPLAMDIYTCILGECMFDSHQNFTDDYCEAGSSVANRTTYNFSFTGQNIDSLKLTMYPKSLTAGCPTQRSDMLAANISFVNITTNQLPFGNITVQGCLNKTTGLGEIQIDLDVVDQENDQIYYYSPAITENFQNRTVKFERIKTSRYCLADYCLPITSAQPDYYFLQNTIDQDNCNVTESIFSTDYHNVINFEYGFLNSVHELELRTNCVGTEKSFIYDLGVMESNIQLQMLLKGLSPVGTFNISLMNSKFEQIGNVQFQIENGRILIKDNSILLKNLTIFDDDMSLKFDRFTEKSFYVKPYVVNSTLPVDDTVADFSTQINKTNNNSIIRYLKIVLSDTTVIRLNSFLYASSILNITWNESYTDTIAIADTGVYPIEILVTDEIYRGENQYRVLSTDIDITTCERTISRQDVQGTGFDFLFGTKFYLGKSFEQYLVAVDGYETGKTMLYWLVFIFFLIILMGQYLFMGSLDISSPFFLSNIAGFFIAWLVNYQGNMLTHAMFVSFGLALIFTASYFGRGAIGSPAREGIGEITRSDTRSRTSFRFSNINKFSNKGNRGFSNSRVSRGANRRK